MNVIFETIHPVLAVQDVAKAIHYYTTKLGFELAFVDSEVDPMYAGVKRDNVELHLQWHDAIEWEQSVDRPMLRMVIKNIEALFTSYAAKGVFHKHTKLRETSWGTREFAFYDPDKNGLTFYENK